MPSSANLEFFMLQNSSTRKFHFWLHRFCGELNRIEGRGHDRYRATLALLRTTLDAMAERSGRRCCLFAT
jgi:hypothetical protein